MTSVLTVNLYPLQAFLLGFFESSNSKSRTRKLIGAGDELTNKHPNEKNAIFIITVLMGLCERSRAIFKLVVAHYRVQGPTLAENHYTFPSSLNSRLQPSYGKMKTHLNLQAYIKKLSLLLLF